LIDRLVNFQAWQGLIKYGAEALDERDMPRLAGLIKLGTLLDVSSALLGVIVALLGAAIIGRIMNWDARTVQMTLIYAWVIAFKLVGTPTGVLRLFDAFHFFAIQNAATALLKLIAIALAAYLGADLFVFIVVWAATDALGFLVLVIAGQIVLHSKGLWRWWRAPIGQWRPFMRFTIWTNLSSTLDIPVKQLDVFIVGAVISLEGVAIYKIFKRTAQLFTQLANPLYQAIYPQFSEMIARGEYAGASRMALRLGTLFTLIASPIVLVIAVTSQWWLNFFGPEYAADWHVFTLFLIISAISVAFISIHPLFTAMGYVKQNFIVLGVANGIYIVLALAFGSALGLMGIVLAYGVQIALVLIPKYVIIRRRVQAQVTAATL
jgi:O-antigen/teichoic acid export membrane protein